MRDFQREIRSALARARLPGAEEADLVEELAQHAEQHYEELCSRGVSEEEAWSAALRAIVDDGEIAARVRSVRGPAETVHAGASGSGLAGGWRDLGFAVRLLRRNPGFTSVSVLTIGLCIGASVSIFAAVNAVVLRPLPFADPDGLYMLWEENPEKGWYKQVTAPANVLDWKANVRGFSDVAAYSDFTREFAFARDGVPQVFRAARVTGTFFSVLGVPPLLGRALREEDTWGGGPERALVLSHRGWTEQFGADEHVVGRTLVLDGQPWTVVGVMPKQLAFPHEDLDGWVTVDWKRSDVVEVWFRRAHWARAIARLKPGVTPSAANAELKSVAQRLEREYPETNRAMGAGMTPLHEFLVGDTRTPLIVLLAAVGLLILIGCANVATLLLVRASTRARELAVRSALGARRSRIVGQMLLESLVLAAAGGTVGLALGWAGTRLLERIQPAGLLRVSQFDMDARVAGFVVLLTVAVGLLFGMLPALWAGRAGAASALRDGRSGGVARGARRAASAIVIAEVALALLLVTGGGLLVRSFVRLQSVHPGFDANDAVAVTLRLPQSRYDTDEKAIAFYTTLLERLRSVRGIEAAAAVSNVPLMSSGFTSDFRIEGETEFSPEVVHRRITPEYFHTMRVPLLKGRAFSAADRDGTEPVLIINEELARRHFRGRDPVGQRITFSRPPDTTVVWSTIVGVAGSERQEAIALPPRIEVFHPLAQSATTAMAVLIRSTGGAQPYVQDLRRVVAGLDPAIPIHDVRSITEIRSASVAQQRFIMLLMLGFAAVAAVLSVVGVYGVTAQVARQRMREIGIRMAFGAREGDIVRLVAGYGGTLAVLGLAAGLLGSLLGARLLRSLLFEVAPTDAATLLAASLLLAAAVLCASVLPAYRATRVDPLEVMRAD